MLLLICLKVSVCVLSAAVGTCLFLFDLLDLSILEIMDLCLLMEGDSILLLVGLMNLDCLVAYDFYVLEGESTFCRG